MTMRVGFLGYGRFGRAIASLAAESGMSVHAFDPGAEVPADVASPSIPALASSAEILVVAVPVERTGEVLERLAGSAGKQHLVMDVGSVKTAPVAAMAKVLGAAVPWVGTHPLFGPTSLVLGEGPFTVVLCPNPLHPAAASRATAFFEALGCRVVEMDAESHDRSMASTHALAYFVAKGMLDAGVDPEAKAAPPSFQAIARTIQSVRADATHLFTAVHTENPFAAEARRRLIDALVAVDRSLTALKTGKEGDNDRENLVIPDLGGAAPDLRETREVIDEVDRELLALLQRRANLARRAARAKAELGRAVRDPAREADLLRSRRDAAAEQGLDPASVEEIFQAILRFSRRVQGDP
jgi:prephenate dehydrogenase